MAEDAVRVLLSVLSEEKFLDKVKALLANHKPVKEVYEIKIDDANLNAFLKGNHAEISRLIQEIKKAQGVKKVEAKVLNPI
jgi:metal-responsive CopG/Arc/MetJ family transcriptional regulator